MINVGGEKMNLLKVVLWFLLIAQLVSLISPHTLNEKILHAILFAILLFSIIAIHKKNKK